MPPEVAKKKAYKKVEKEAESLFSRVQPHDVDAEQAILASCLLEGGNETISFCDELKVNAECFYKAEHQIIFQAIHDVIHKDRETVDEIILINKLKSNGKLDDAGGYQYINRFADRIKTTAHTPQYIKIVREKYLLRRLIKTTSEALENCYTRQDDLPVFLEQVEQEIFNISQDRITDSAVHISAPLEEVVKMVHQLINKTRSQYGVQTQFTKLDNLTLGLHGTEMIVLAGRPGTGKTSFAMNVVENALLPKGDTPPTPTLVFSLEMGVEQLALRLLCANARVDMKRVREGFLNKEEQQQLAEASQNLRNIPLYIDDSAGLNILELRAKARRVHAKNKLGMIVVDYLQLLNGMNSTVAREQQVAEVSRGLKGLAKELNVPVLVLAQLNRKAEDEQREPRPSDLRESGSIEQDADVILILHRPKKKKDDLDEEEVQDYGVRQIDLIVAKNRNGPTDTIPLTFINRYTRFENFADESYAKHS